MKTERGRELVSSAFREVGLQLMQATVPLARTVVGLPLAGATFMTGWALQFAAAPTNRHAAARCEDDRSECDEATAELLG
ncbi:MAG: hypothetical protein HOO96_02125 [Polyangiaceae bacterium]|nr:hypothetical protein [Polyangiaceae bacterium]